MVSSATDQATCYDCELTLQVVVTNPAPGADVADAVRRAAEDAAAIVDGHVTGVDIALTGAPAMVTVTIGYQTRAASPQEAEATGYGALFPLEPAARQIAQAVGGRLKTTQIWAVRARVAA